MDIMKNYIALSHKIAIYIPSEKQTGEFVDNSEFVNECATLLSSEFGGATVADYVGYWTHENRLATESVKYVYAYASELSDISVKKVLEFVHKMKSELQQESIAIEINNQLYLI